MRKNLNDLQQIRQTLPSLLGHIFRQAVFHEDRFNYDSLLLADNKVRLSAWQDCRTAMGMHYSPEKDEGIGRHQYFDS